MKPTSLLVILDGWGHAEASPYNAIHVASTPNWDRFLQHSPNTLLNCCGTDVGLPQGQMGNSEVGHMTIGAGRAIPQDLYRIDQAIGNGSFCANGTLQSLLSESSSKTLHVMGLLSPGGVHSHQRHFESLIQLDSHPAVNLIVHAFLDGRDTPPKSALTSLTELEELLRGSGKGRIGSICGRYFAMDRDKRWDRTHRAYQMLTSGDADYRVDNVAGALQQAYERGESDEFVKPTLIGPAATVEDGDCVLFMNFRADRARQLTHAFIDKEFNEFPRIRHPKVKRFVTLTSYGSREEFSSNSTPLEVLFDKQDISNTLGEFLEQLGKNQLRVAETEKYAHVTYFFSGGNESKFKNESREFIPSPKVPTYDLKPEMSAGEITVRVTQAIRDSEFDFIVCNFANGDMVGHTGNLKASVKAVEVIDQCLGDIDQAVRDSDSHCLITADHGNVECLMDQTKETNHTAHTLNQVPLVYLGPTGLRFRSHGTLADVSPTLLDLMGLDAPRDMTGKTLIERC